LLVAGGAALVIWRSTAVEEAALLVLAERGFPQASFSVQEISQYRLVITDLSLGPYLPNAERVTVEFEPAALVEGRVAAVTIDGARFVVEGDGQQLLQRLGLSSPGEERASAESSQPGIVLADLPAVTINGLEIRLVDTVIGSGLLQASGNARLVEQALDARVEVRFQADLMTGSLTVASTHGGTDRDVEVVGEIDFDFDTLLVEKGASNPLSAALMSHVSGGQAFAAIEGRLTEPKTEPLSLSSWAKTPLQLAIKLKAQNLARASAPERLDADLNAAVETRATMPGISVSLGVMSALHIREIAPEHFGPIVPPVTDTSPSVSLHLEGSNWTCHAKVPVSQLMLGNPSLESQGAFAAKG
jgi:hypothetical protein